VNIMVYGKILLVVAMLSIGQILFKTTGIALKQSGASIMSASVLLPFATAGIVYALASLLWVNALSETPLAIAYPITALSFVLVPMASYYFFQEQLNVVNMIGLGAIIIGVALSQYR